MDDKLSSDLAGSLSQWTKQLASQKQRLEIQLGRLKVFQNDYDALEKQLQTLPDETTRQAMIPIGSLAFMPGKLIHTNEITVYLGSDYYAERSAKQALQILGRRKQVVTENMQLLEDQLKGLTSKEDAKYGAFPSGELGVNEEGLPIMEIREELPTPNQEANQQQPSASPPEPPKPAASTTTDGDNKHMKDVLALLQQLEGEEEDEDEDEGQQDAEQDARSLRESSSKRATHHLSSDDDESSDDNDELDDRYDTEIADNMFDHFDDDEEYAIQGVVEQEDASIYEEGQEDHTETEVTKATVLESTVADVPPATPGSSTEGNPSRFKAAQKQQDIQTASPTVEPASIPKKMSRFKAARREEKQPARGDRIPSVETTSTAVAEAPDVSQQIPVVASVGSPAAAGPRKESRFKAARGQRSENGIPTVKATATSSTSSDPPSTAAGLEKHDPARDIPSVQTTSSAKQRSIPQVATSTSEHAPASRQRRGIPIVEPASEKKKTSRFKAARQQAREQEAPPPSSSTPSPALAEGNEALPTQQTDESGKRRVTWDEVATVQEHDRLAAPSETTLSDTYTSPVKQGVTADTIPQMPQVIRSPADIFKVVKAQRQILLDDGYPSLETGEDDFDTESTVVSMDELRRSAELGKQELWQLKDGPDNPLIAKDTQPVSEQQNLPKMPKGKLDTNIMKGAVLERETEKVDMDQVEADMDLREVTSSYHQKRYDIVAAMGGYTFESKDTYEVVDEELPLPSAQSAKKKQPEPESEQKPKKMSRFKASRLAKFEKQEEQ